MISPGQSWGSDVATPPRTMATEKPKRKRTLAPGSGSARTAIQRRGKQAPRRDPAPHGSRDARGDDRVAYAVIGQGHFAQSQILPAFAGAPNCELRAIFSEDETKLRVLKRKYGVETALGYDQFDEYLRSGAVDAVYVALPNDLHYEYVVRAARARVHVLCEKPLAMSSVEAERMIAACDDNGIKLMVG